MVVLLVKVGSNHKDQLYHYTSVSQKVYDVVEDLVMKWNLRKKIFVLAENMEDLAKKGPNKELLMLGGKVPPRGKSYKEDELGERNGRALSGRLLQVFNEIIGQARNLVETSSYKNASQKEFVDFLDKMRGAITMAYPIGLPEWDPVQALVDPKSQVELWDLVQGCLNPQETELWWAGKKLDKNTLLSERIGKNDKCKLKCRLAKSGSGPPLREPLISEKERKQMMALYYKKQGEHKKLSEDTDDQYLFQQWADPNSLKQRLNGTGNIRLF